MLDNCSNRKDCGRTNHTGCTGRTSRTGRTGRTSLRLPQALALAVGVFLALSACSSPVTGPPTQTKAQSDTQADTQALPQLPAEQAAQVSNINVFAASSTRVINNQLEAAVARDFPQLKLVFNNAGSTTLVHQVEEGAPADILITASKRTMDQAVEARSVEKPVKLATNHMVMVVPKGNPGNIHSVTDLRDNHFLVLCDPTVPCGDVSSRIIKAQALDLHPDSLENQVADVLGKVVSGEADAGWVYSTDAAAAIKDVEVIDIPGALDFPNSIYGAVVTGTAHPHQAAKVLDILSNGFGAEWSRSGFSPAV